MANDLDNIRAANRRYKALHREEILARQRKRRAENPEKTAELKRKFRLLHPERIVAANKAYRLANRDKIAASKKKYLAEHPGQQLAYERAYYIRYPEKGLAKQESRKLRERAKRIIEKSINTIRHDPDTVYRVVSRAVSSALPRFMRDDVIASMLLAVLEGKLLLENVGARVKDYVTGYNREYDTIKTLSLDAPMGGTDLRRIDLLEAPAPYEPEDDEDPDMVMLTGGYSRW
ncbi:hypothetical protein [Mesorhizobium sp. B2-6-4]|uniref:hypothetical protein n=1 Tax=Mesorhizobium sp. B2-6-4 TaxID=2589913 RepID=UPI00112CB7CF|nr:hypothetical protein [Mesorhizobium sp. B2-6-4]TPJ52690.1 hypothetical protein FJ426_15660 [Mesorhizobium sp. B2-6-4]